MPAKFRAVRISLRCARRPDRTGTRPQGLGAAPSRPISARRLPSKATIGSPACRQRADRGIRPCACGRRLVWHRPPHEGGSICPGRSGAGL